MYISCIACKLYRYFTKFTGVVLHVHCIGNDCMYMYCAAFASIVLYVKVMFCMDRDRDYRYCIVCTFIVHCTGIVLHVHLLYIVEVLFCMYTVKVFYCLMCAEQWMEVNGYFLFN